MKRSLLWATLVVALTISSSTTSHTQQVNELDRKSFESLSNDVYPVRGASSAVTEAARREAATDRIRLLEMAAKNPEYVPLLLRSIELHYMDALRGVEGAVQASQVSGRLQMDLLALQTLQNGELLKKR